MTAYYNEYDPFAAQWLRNLVAAGHLPPGDVDSRSILDVQPEDLNGYDQCHFFAGIGIWGYALRRVGWPDDRGIWSGSCPCQPFSAAGRGLGFTDERHLWPAWFHLIAQRRPATVVGEQVASKDGLEWFDLVSTDLENAGYAVGSADLCAAGFAEQGRDGGGFHLRQRQYFLATLEGLDNATSARRSEARRGEPGQPEGGQCGPQLGCVGDGLANPHGWEREQFASPRRDGVRGAASSAPQLGERLGYRSARIDEPIGMADPRDQRRGETRDGRPEAGQRSSGTMQLGELAQPQRSRREMAVLEPRDCGAAQSGGETSKPRGHGYVVDDTERQHGVPDNDARRPNANLVYCRDGRWRPVEPGAFPLAYAVPRSMGAMRPELRALCDVSGFSERDLADARKYRAGALKAFGNALDGETVVAFLEAAMECAP